MMQTRRRMAILSGVVVLALLLLGTGAVIRGFQPAGSRAASYTPQTRNFTVTAVPLLVHEMQGTLGYLQKDFAKGGLLYGKEVYGFYPSTLVVYQGDTVNVTLVNPEDDPHTFTIAELGVNVDMKAQSSTNTSFVANQVGTFTFMCAEAEHAPFMWGQLVVLPASAAPQH